MISDAIDNLLPLILFGIPLAGIFGGLVQMFIERRTAKPTAPTRVEPAPLEREATPPGPPPSDEEALATRRHPLAVSPARDGEKDRRAGDLLDLAFAIGARQKMDQLRKLPPHQAASFRFCGLLLLAHEVLQSFHRHPGLVALDFRCDFDKNDRDETYLECARNFFVSEIGHIAGKIGISHKTVPLTLLGAGQFLVERTHPVVERSLGSRARDDVLHSCLVHELAWELNASFANPALQPLAR